MQPTNNEGTDQPIGAPAARLGFLRPQVFAVCTGAWLAFACFLWMRDFLMVGSEARGLAPDEMLLTIQSMITWGLFSPFILTAAELLEFDAGKRLRALGLHVICALALAAFDVTVDMVMSAIHHLEEGGFAWRFYREVLVNTFSYAIVAAIGYALVYQRRLAASRLGTLELQRELAQARLDVLARTLQPHFLFNSLNTVTALVRLNENKRALSAVVALSDLLRIVLKTRGEARIPLAEELEFTERYCAVEQLRFEDRLAVEGDIQRDAETLLVPALILQPLVENAIRHGVESSGRGRVTIEAYSTPEWLNLAVRVRSFGEGGEPRVAGLGIGLDVTRRRLVYLYGHERFALELLVGCGHSTVSLRIPREETVYVRTDPDGHRR
jgi:two-component system, LytTR family, sensor kinase